MDQSATTEGPMANAYHDRLIECSDAGVRVRGYYFPWGTKTIPYASIRGLDRFTMTGWRGKARIWGSGDLRHWANLDPHRPQKSVGFFVDIGRRVVPFLTPDDPDAFERVVTERAGLARPGRGGPPPSPSEDAS
jgi:hypothetical protein